MHTNLASHLSQQISLRSLDKYFEAEEILIFKKYISGKVISEHAWPNKLTRIKMNFLLA